MSDEDYIRLLVTEGRRELPQGEMKRSRAFVVAERWFPGAPVKLQWFDVGDSMVAAHHGTTFTISPLED